jgi:cytochrome c-type biogenesis protein CcsB
MKKFYQFIISMPFLAVMLIIYAASMGVATFIENDYGAGIARYFVYNTWWFELIQLILVVNFVGNIFKYRLYKRAKWSIFLFHLAFAVILIGAGITRYFGYEGIIHIREGETENKFVSEKDYMIIKHANESDSIISKEELFVSPNIKNNYKTNFEYGGEKFEFEIVKLIPRAVRSLQPDENGTPMMELVVGTKSGMQSYYITNRSSMFIQGMPYTLNNDANPDTAINFTSEKKSLYIQAPFELSKSDMKGETDTLIPAGSKTVVKPYHWYSYGENRFVVTNFQQRGKITYIEAQKEERSPLTVLSCIMRSAHETKDVFLPVVNDQAGESVSVKIAKNHFLVSYGAVEKELPFALKLRDFQLERYPGSESPSSFASEVTLIDTGAKVNKDFRIFMNNILEHKGYRFYQTSYDPDEKGTILSINHDKPGTYVTYFGYLLLVLGTIWALFSKHSYFTELSKKSAELRKKRKGLATAILVLFMFVSQSAFSQDQGITKIDKKHADHFGKMLVQDNAGRIKPFNTLSSELTRKISRKESLEGLNHNQVIMGMMFNPELWESKPIIKIGHPDLMKMLGTNEKLVAFNKFVDLQKGEYLLKEHVNKAFEKQPGQRDKFDKEIIAVDERINLVYQVFQGQFLKVFPMPGDTHHKWMIPSDAKKIKDKAEKDFVAGIFTNYYLALVQAQETNNWENTGFYVDSLIAYQKKHAGEVIPSDTKIKMEIQYVNMDVFNRIFKFYGIIGFLYLIVLFAGIVRPKLKISLISLIMTILLGIIFLVQTYGLGVRWYISGHAPWSNGYETMIYISWATMLAGFIFMKRSPIVLAATALLASITLMVAHLSWMDPQISNLVPVLKSYWLTIHVSVITASYGFLGLGALLGFLNLILMLMKNPKNRDYINITIDELSVVNHMTLIIGLYLLTIGTFLGAVWANESWGRYWGWDPKETWALITIIVYTLVLHTRFIPALNQRYAFNLMSLLAISSVLMTFFGVNYYLSGLHSYAQGDPVPIPGFVYISIAVIALVAILAYFRNYMAELNVKKAE